MYWRNLIAGCFGAMDHLFARHPNDAERAKAMLTRAFAEGAGWQDIEQAARDHLSAQGCSQSHIDAEVAVMTDVRNYLDGLPPNYFTFSASNQP